MRNLRQILTRLAEIIGVFWFLVMFVTFLLQVFTRYVLNDPLGWTTELCLIAFVWFAFWSGGLLVRPSDQVRFDLLYLMAGEKLRRYLAIISTLALSALFLAGLYANYDFVTFMKIDVTPVLEVRYDYVFAVFLIFMVALGIRYALHVLRLLRSGWQDEL